MAIDEQSYGPDHPNVARDLNNLAQLLKATNRLAEAEPLMRRHVVIFRKFGQATGYEHPHMRTATENYRQLLEALGLSEHQIAARLQEILGNTAEA